MATARHEKGDRGCSPLLPPIRSPVVAAGRAGSAEAGSSGIPAAASSSRSAVRRCPPRVAAGRVFQINSCRRSTLKNGPLRRRQFSCSPLRRSISMAIPYIPGAPSAGASSMPTSSLTPRSYGASHMRKSMRYDAPAGVCRRCRTIPSVYILPPTAPPWAAKKECRKPQVAAASDSLTLKGNGKSHRSPSGSGGRQRRAASGTATLAATRAG